MEVSKEREIVYVEWIDSCMLSEQISPHELPGPVIIESVGFVVAEDDVSVTLVRDIHEDRDMRGVIVIPQVAIRNRMTMRYEETKELEFDVAGALNRFDAFTREAMRSCRGDVYRR